MLDASGLSSDSENKFEDRPLHPKVFDLFVLPLHEAEIERSETGSRVVQLPGNTMASSLTVLVLSWASTLQNLEPAIYGLCS